MAPEALLVSGSEPAVRSVVEGQRVARVGGCADALRGFSEVMSALDDSASVDELLRLIAAKACELVGVCRCSVWLRDRDSALFRGRVVAAGNGADAAGNGADAAMRGLTAGIAADGFTREILATMGPVVIRDVLHDPRPVRSTMLQYGIRAMLGVPMRLRGEVVGLLFLDNEDRPHPYSAEDQRTAAAFADLAAIGLDRHRVSSELRTRLETVSRQNRLLRHIRILEAQLQELVLRGGGLPAIARFVCEVTRKPAAICDARLRSHASAVPPEGGAPRPRLLDVDLRGYSEVRGALERVAPGECAVIGPFPAVGVVHRHVVAPIDVCGERWGYVVLMEHLSRLGALDRCVVQRAAEAAALDLTVQGRVAAAELDARASLARELIAGGVDTDRLVRCAAYLGVGIDSDHVAVLVSPRQRDTAGSVEAIGLASACAQRLGASEVLGTVTEVGVVLFAEVGAGEPRRAAVARIKKAISEVCRQVTTRQCLIVGISSACRDIAGFAQAYREAREVTDCIRTVGMSERETAVLAADDLGPARLLLARAAAGEVDRFLEDIVGPLMDNNESSVELLRTLQFFFDEGRSARRSATRLDVHENTIRYRLARFRALTGLDVAGNANDQLSVHVALLALRLRGRAGLTEVALDPPGCA